MHQGIITFDSQKGWYFAENLTSHSRTFIHINAVENQRYLKVNDRVSFDVVPNPDRPGKTMAVNVRFLGRVIARQTSTSEEVL